MIDMGLQITHLGSGSRGNSTLLESDSCKVLIDCGFSLKQTEKRLSTIKIEPSSIDAIFITHHHGDHSKSALKASQKWGSNLYCNIETAINLSSTSTSH